MDVTVFFSYGLLLREIDDDVVVVDDGMMFLDFSGNDSYNILCKYVMNI